MSPNGEANKGRAISILSASLLEPACVYCQRIWMKHETKGANPQEEELARRLASVDSSASETREPACDLFLLVVHHNTCATVAESLVFAHPGANPNYLD